LPCGISVEGSLSESLVQGAARELNASGIMELDTSHFVLVSLLLLISLIAMLARRFRVPYTVALVLAGLAIGLSNILPDVQLTPGLVLFVFLPALIFDSAFRLDFHHLMQNRRQIAFMAIPAPLISTILVGTALHLLLGLDLPSALLFGALISATDPVSVAATFRELGVPKRLAYIIEGESLFNDGMAIVLYRIIVLMILTGEFSLLGNVARFVIVVLGGGMLGLVAGYLFSLLVRRIDDHLVEITLTTVLAYGTYLLADSFHLSGVIAVVVAGVVITNYGFRTGMSPTTKIALDSFWEYVAFIVNSFVFLLIGMQINLSLIAQNLYPIALAVLTVLGARALISYVLPLVSRAFSKHQSIPLAWQHILFWGGFRGSLSVAVALSIPLAIQGRDQILVMTFGVVLFSLVVQGLTMRPLLRILGMAQPSAERTAYEYKRGKLLATKAILDSLHSMERNGLVSASVCDELTQRYESLGQNLSDEIAKLQAEAGFLAQDELKVTQRKCLQVAKSTLQDLVRQGVISDDVFRRLVSDMDTELQEIG
jgi:CPA1 family monovalent cation:H+ antiporter